MSFKNLSSPLQQNLLKELKRITRTLLHNMDYIVIKKKESFITDTFVQQVFVCLETMHSSKKHIPVKLSNEELKTLLQQIEYSMRNRKSTLRQRNYFNSLLYDLKLQEDIPKDNLCMKKRLLELEHMKKQQKKLHSQTPASTQQIKLLKQTWKKTFGRELKVSTDLKQNEVDSLFMRIYRKQRKLDRKNFNKL